MEKLPSPTIEQTISEVLPRAPAAPAESFEVTNRCALQFERQRLLGEVDCFNSDEIAMMLEAAPENPSESAVEYHSGGKIFGVCWSGAWRYPKFQFDQTGMPFKEMHEVL